MIYTGKVKPASLQEHPNLSLIDFFNSYEAQQIMDRSILSDDEKLSEFKRTTANGFISGKVKTLYRNDENLICRDCLVLDLDDVKLSEERLIEWLKSRFNDVSYIAYPSIRNGIEGVRYRLVLPFEGEVRQKEDYKLLVDFFTKYICREVVGIPDESNKTWSQLMLLPIITPYCKKESLLIHQSKKVLPLTAMLEGAQKWQQANQPKQRKAVKLSSKGRRYRNSTTELLESLVAGCNEGNRNNRIAKITGDLLVRAVDVAAVWELVVFANNHFSPPLDDKELENTFYSIARRELTN